jgi:hypothetical protein
MLTSYYAYCDSSECWFNRLAPLPIVAIAITPLRIIAGIVQAVVASVIGGVAAAGCRYAQHNGQEEQLLKWRQITYIAAGELAAGIYHISRGSIELMLAVSTLSIFTYLFHQQDPSLADESWGVTISKATTKALNDRNPSNCPV